ncbi:Flap-structured DNA-binding and RNA-binding protein, partial [Rhizopus azygosporus]
RPKSADISQWNLPGQYSVWSQIQPPPAEDTFNRRTRINQQRTTATNNIPAVPETAEDYPMKNNASDDGRLVDMELLKDVPAWLRSLRLHKYNPIFGDMRWQDMVKMSDQELLNKGVAALGARRKMLKVFENVKAHCEANNIEY